MSHIWLVKTSPIASNATARWDDRYRAKVDKESGLVHNPNAWSDDPQYIVDLVKRVVRVSMETLRKGSTQLECEQCL